MPHQPSLLKTEPLPLSASPCTSHAPGAKSYLTHFSTSACLIQEIRMDYSGVSLLQRDYFPVVEGNNHFPQCADCHLAWVTPSQRQDIAFALVRLHQVSVSPCLCSAKVPLKGLIPGIEPSRFPYYILMYYFPQGQFFFLRTNLVLPFDAV